jgi:transcriptional regulator with XRE-family HTH domain
MDILLLDYEMKKRGYSREKLAAAIGISRSAFYRKCNGKSEFTLAEIKAIASVLQLNNTEEIFFANKVS